jgi:hypothetical protein
MDQPCFAFFVARDIATNASGPTIPAISQSGSPSQEAVIVERQAPTGPHWQFVSRTGIRVQCFGREQ